MVQEYEVSLMLTNDKNIPIDFVLEPWGEVYVMEPRVRWIVILRSFISPIGLNRTEVVYGIDCITVCGWQGCAATLFQNGEEVPRDGVGERSRVPKIPGE